MDGLVGAGRMPEGDVGEVRDHLVAVHVERRAGAGLEDVDDELCAQRVVAQDAVTGGDDGVGQLRLQHAEVAVGERARFLQEDEGADEEGMGAEAADGIVLDRPLGLRAVKGVVGHVNFAEGVGFDAHGPHGSRGVVHASPGPAGRKADRFLAGFHHRSWW